MRNPKSGPVSTPGTLKSSSRCGILGVELHGAAEVLDGTIAVSTLACIEVKQTLATQTVGEGVAGVDLGGATITSARLLPLSASSALPCARRVSPRKAWPRPKVGTL
jgi:hypothetical protein